MKGGRQARSAEGHPGSAVDYLDVVSLPSAQHFFQPHTDSPGEILAPKSKAPPLNTTALVDAADALADPNDRGKPNPLRIFVASYASIVDRARYARAEPTESDAAAVEKVVAFVRNLVEVKKQRRESKQ